jgi:hypothetical protein
VRWISGDLLAHRNGCVRHLQRADAIGSRDLCARSKSQCCTERRRFFHARVTDVSQTSIDNLCRGSRLTPFQSQIQSQMGTRRRKSELLINP